MSLVDGIERLHYRFGGTATCIPRTFSSDRRVKGVLSPCAVFIDTRDFKDGTVDVVTTAYVPANYERISSWSATSTRLP